MRDTRKIHVLSRALIVDEAHILLCKTVELNHNFYFLPGGHVENGESVESALIRELEEETNVKASIKRFLGCVEYHFEPDNPFTCHNHEYSFVFEVQAATLKKNKPLTQVEAHIELLWMAQSSLNTIDFRPAPMKEVFTQWLAQTPNDALHFISSKGNPSSDSFKVIL